MSRSIIRKCTALTLTTSLLLSSCTTLDSAGNNERNGAIGGTMIGALLGGVIGKQVGGDKGMVLGALLGAALGDYFGGKIGASYDERDRRIAKIKANFGVSIQRDIYSTLDKKDEKIFESKVKKMNKQDQQSAYQSKAIYKTVVPAQFASGSAKLSPKMTRFYTDIAKAYKADGMRKVMIVGHADSSGDARMNQRLSEKRARTVARIFRKEGYPASGIYYQGAGETEPIADNATVLGRNQNRRVEIIDANKTHGLVIAKQISIAESKSIVEKTPPQKIVKKPPVVTIAENLSETDSIIPFKGYRYRGQSLLSQGHMAKNAEEPIGFLAKIANAIGKASSSFVDSANAATDIQRIPLFLDDDFAVAGEIRRLDNVSESLYQPSDHMPAYYNQPVYTYINGNAFISLQPISILKEARLSNPQPLMIVYKKFDGKGDKADANLKGLSRLYISGNNMLYRWKATNSSVKKSGILGLDIMLPKYKAASFSKTHNEYLDSQVYYLKAGHVYVEKIKLTIKLNKTSEIEWRL